MTAGEDNSHIGFGRLIRDVFASALVYCLLGALGISFAIAPGYASPIFPAAGFAVAILLWSEGRAWPGIWLGSFALNASVSALHGMDGWTSAWTASLIACGAAAQGLVARYAIIKVAGEGWRRLEQERDIIVSLALAGPVACLASATIGISSLVLGGVIALQDALYAWWNWWSGDSLGVLVILPLSLGLLYRTRAPWRGRLTTLFVPMLIALFVVAAAFRTVAWLERQEQQANVRGYGERMAKLFEQRFIAHQEALSALRRLLEVTPEMSFQHFEHFTRITLRDNPDIFALSINPLVALAERPAFERLMARKTATPGFAIRERDSQQRLITAADRDQYVSVAYIAPLEANRLALGYDINSEPVRHEAIQKALQSGLPSVTAPIQLVQESQKQAGVLLLHPARRLVDAQSLDPSAPAFLGFAVGVIKIREMVEIATQGLASEGIIFEILDAQLPSEQGLLYRTQSQDRDIVSDMAWEARLMMANRPWIFRVTPTRSFLRQSHVWIPFAVGIGGLALAALLQVLLLVITGRTSLVQRIVNEQTAELQAKSKVVEDRNAQLNALFTLSPDAFVAFALDGRVKFANPAFERLTAIPKTQIVDHTEEVLDAALRERCAEPAHFQGIAAFFGAEATGLQRKQVELKVPRQAVLEIVGIRSDSSSVSRILYLRDITYETEIDRMKSAFLSHAAHELRTPMSSIYGFSELLMNMDFDESTRRELLGNIHRQTKWLIDIINELLDLARIDAGRGIELKLEDVDLPALVRETVEDMVIDQARWPLRLELPAAARRVSTDRMKLRQALLNVLDNAAKYSPEGGEIRVSLCEMPGMHGVKVTDAGIGMSREQLDKFGERFWRADTSGATPGAGLGIAIVKELLALMKGRLEVASEPNKGTSATLWLPAIP